jgi:hypothetical protein
MNKSEVNLSFHNYLSDACFHGHSISQKTRIHQNKLINTLIHKLEKKTLNTIPILM